MTDLDKMARELFLARLPAAFSRETYIDDDGEEQYSDEWVQGAWIGFSAALLTAPPGHVMVPDSASCRHREASTRLGQELELAKRQIQSQQKVIGRLRQDMFLLDELERVWFWQSPTQRARMATAPCWSAGDHSDLRSALAAAFRDTAQEVK